MKKIRVAIVGCGAITQRRHAPEYDKNPKAEIAGFYDSNPELLSEVCEEYSSHAYASFDEILSDESIDAVSICAPNRMHADMSIRALETGKHVLCEKPMALSTTETLRMLEAEKLSGKILMPGHNQRLAPAHLRAKELISSGTIGRPFFFQTNFKHSGPEGWSIDKSTDTWFMKKSQAQYGVIADLGSHKIDVMRFLLGDEFSKVSATLSTLDKRYNDGSFIDVEDNVVCQLITRNGIQGVMHVSWVNYGKEDNSTVIYGDKGTMKIYSDYADDIVIEERSGHTVKYAVGQIATNGLQIKSGVIDEFIAAISENRKPVMTGIDGHNTLAVIEASVKSAGEARWTDVVY